MDAFQIKGGVRISGEVTASGSKNAALPILAACLLTDDEICLENVPDLRDINTMLKLLDHLGRKTVREGKNIIVRQGPLTANEAPYELVSKMRASIAVLGPLLTRLREAKVSFPGGCAIGTRPIDLHLKGLEALGARISVEHGYVHATTDGLQGVAMHLAGPFGSSVLATDNVLMAAVLAEGETVIEAAALEPEVVDTCHFLQAMGAKIEGVGTSVLRVQGVARLHGCTYRVIPDRIEAGTLLTAAAATGGELFVKNAWKAHLGKVLEVLQGAGAEIDVRLEGIHIKGPEQIQPVNIETLPYPEFPTDMQAPLMALLLRGRGTSVITEKIYPDRFIHVAEFNRMGADIRIEGTSALVQGVRQLEGAPVMASDLRAGAALVIAALCAEGESLVRRVYHIDRGYEELELKLNRLGAEIVRVKDEV